MESISSGRRIDNSSECKGKKAFVISDLIDCLHLFGPGSMLSSAVYTSWHTCIFLSSSGMVMLFNKYGAQFPYMEPSFFFTLIIR